MIEDKNYKIDLISNCDIENIVEVYNSNTNFLVNHLNSESVSINWYKEELEAMISDGFVSCKIVDKVSNKIIGTVDFKEDEISYLSILMIHSKYRKKGIGGRIFKLIEDYLRTKQCQSIRIDVVTSYDDKVTEFWKRVGFKQIDTIELEWCGNSLPAALMIKDLVMA